MSAYAEYEPHRRPPRCAGPTAKGVTAPSRGRWTLEHKVAMRRNIIDLTIVQAGAGLRIAEARQASARTRPKTAATV